MKITWLDGLQFVGVPVRYNVQMLEVANFSESTHLAVDKTNKAIKVLMQGAELDNEAMKKNGANCLIALQKDLERGAREDVFNFEDVKKVVEVITNLVADPIGYAEKMEKEETSIDRLRREVGALLS